MAILIVYSNGPYLILLRILCSSPSRVTYKLNRNPLSSRSYFATIKVIRAREFHTWRYGCTRTHRVAEILVHTAIALTIMGLTYANLVFAAKFDR